MSDKKEVSGETIFRHRYYVNGAHAGNVRYSIEFWGMNGPAREAEFKRRLEEFLTQQQID